MANWTPASPSLVGTSCLWPDYWISQAYQKKVVSGLRSLSHPVGAASASEKRNKADPWWKKMKVENIRKAYEGLLPKHLYMGKGREKEERVGKGK